MCNIEYYIRRGANSPPRATGFSGNDELQRDLSAARAPSQAQTRVATNEPAPSGVDKNEPLPVRRERVQRDLRKHTDDRRTQIYIVAVNIGQMMGLRWMDGQLRTQPIKPDKAEVGKMCREYGGPAHVWTVACRIAGHEIAGDPLDYLWGALKTEHERSMGQGQTKAGTGDFAALDHRAYETV